MSKNESKRLEELEKELRDLSIIDINNHPSKTRDEIALNFFDLATKKESIGQLNDAADFYRKAFKLNEKVDLVYRERYFSKGSAGKNVDSNYSNGGDSNKNKAKINAINVNKLLESFSESEIYSLEDEEEVVSPMNKLPNEIIEHIMIIVMEDYQPSWVAFSLTCKKMAFIGFKTMNLWRYLSQNLIYSRQRYCEDKDDKTFSYLIKSQWGFNYYKMLNERPFLKFNGVYISKITYMREGERDQNSNSWNLPFKMITYYRYYRFYATGECLKLSTILEPEKVIKHLRAHSLKSKVEDRLAAEVEVDANSHSEWLKVYHGSYNISFHGDVEIRSNGSVDKYLFIDKFKIVSGGKWHRHNKLQWVSMEYQDRLLKTVYQLNTANERDFIFSRVKSYYVT